MPRCRRLQIAINEEKIFRCQDFSAPELQGAIGRQEQRMFCTFDPLDDSIRSGGVDDETFAWIADSLMMGGINFHFLALKNLCNSVPRSNSDDVAVWNGFADVSRALGS